MIVAGVRVAGVVQSATYANAPKIH